MCVAGGLAQLYVTSNFTTSADGFVYIAPGASLVVYVGGSFTMGEGFINSGNATNLVCYGLPTSTNSSYTGSTPFRGIVYAPQAHFLYNGSNGMSGAVVVSSFTLSGTNGLHFDENVARVTCAGVIDAPQLLNNNLVFSFSTFSNQTYSIQQSFDLLQWLDYTQFAGDGSYFQFSTPATNPTAAFFRLSAVPAAH